MSAIKKVCQEVIDSKNKPSPGAYFLCAARHGDKLARALLVMENALMGEK